MRIRTNRKRADNPETDKKKYQWVGGEILNQHFQLSDLPSDVLNVQNSEYEILGISHFDAV